MHDRTRKVIRILLAISLLVCTAVAAFVAGYGVSTLVSEQRLQVGLGPAPVVSPTAEPSILPSTPSAPTQTPARPAEETFQLFWEVWDILQRDYYGELPDMQAVTYGAIRGMLETLGDEYTSFIEPTIADILSEDATGSFEGIGAFVQMRDDGKLEIASVFPEQPADRAGLQERDRILAVDGESIVGYTIYEAIALIRGPAGSRVTLEVERPEDGTFEVILTRAEIEIPLVETEMLEGDIGYIRLMEFSTPATNQMEEGLERLLAEEPVALVFDLRGNPGGWLEQAVSVADLFLGDHVVLIERSSDGAERVFRAGDGDLAEAIPLVVLVNGGTASASEIVAGAIQDHERAVLMGEQTLGKGSVQRPYRLSDGSELRVTTALWFTPNDVAIHEQGLTPDIEVPLPDDLEPGEDPQLDRAVEYLLAREE
ncbi:MAG: S41 family peptidase [Anaerolineae bacterium]|jgi:carboxyl-terminal processing protease